MSRTGTNEASISSNKNKAIQWNKREINHNYDSIHKTAEET